MSEPKKAPWKDKNDNEVFEGSEIVHTTGETGIVFYEENEDPHDSWLVNYGKDIDLENIHIEKGHPNRSRLSLQLDKGEAVVVDISEDVKNMIHDIDKDSKTESSTSLMVGNQRTRELEKTIQPDNSPLSVMMNALNNGMSLDKVEKMMELQERYEKREAEKAYNSAMAEFKKIPVVINKDMVNEQYNSKYSSIGATVNPISPIMAECGLSHKWDFDSETDPKFITGKCVVTHKDGHSDSVSMTCPIDMSGKKNPIQQIKSTRTYIRIETFTSVMGLTSSEDVSDDGNGASPQQKVITNSQYADLTSKIEEKGVDEKKFLSFFM